MNREQKIPEDQQNQLALLSAFSDNKDKNEVILVLNELLNDNKIKLITDLSQDEIKLITAINMIAKMKDLGIWEQGTDLYMQLLLSKERKSRIEIINAVKGFTERRVRGLAKLFGRHDEL